MIRTEEKYLISFQEFQYMKSFLDICFERDKHADEGYWVHSEYFDTQDNDFYYQKVDGLYEHIKIRKRWYNEGDSFYEMKYKKNISQIKKKLTLDEIKMLSYEWGGKSIFPKVKVSYKREAFEAYLQGSRTRITFDQDLKVASSSGNSYSLDMGGKILMEVKFENKLNPIIVNQLKKMGSRKTPFSKYETAVTFLNNLNYL